MKSFILAALLFFGWAARSQQPDSADSANNEIKVNLLTTLLEFPEFSYERITGDNTSVGMSLGFALNDEIGLRFGALPYFRMYFGEGHARGFFVELNAAVITERDVEFVDFDTQDETARAMGKFLTTSGGWIGEVYLGVGRYLNNGSDFDWGYPRIGISIGKRF